MRALDLGPEDARRLLLEGLVDYAGLFPPAALSMPDAVARYGEYLGSENAWALGKFVLPVARLGEFEAVVPASDRGAPWQLALIAGPDFSADVRVIEAFAQRTAQRAIVRAIEVKATTALEIGAIATNTALLRVNIPGAFDVYVEVPVAADPSALIQSIAAHGLRAKVRTGGVEAGAFPDAAQLSRFVRACAAHGVTFKATAGLHHALRGSYPFTYDPASDRGTMFGFLNVFVAALFAREGLDDAAMRALLEERDASGFAFNTSGVTWRGRTVTAAAIRSARADTAVSFGSCSFTEPIADLSSLGLL
jgi:hypothetical protein